MMRGPQQRRWAPTTRKDLVFVNDRLRISQGDVYAVYTNQADSTDSLTFQGVTQNATTGNLTSKLYTGTPVALSIGNGTQTVTGPASGSGFLGFVGGVINQQQTGLTNGTPFLSGVINGSLGIYPAALTQDPNGLNTLYAGLTVGFGLETPAVLGASVGSETLGGNFTNATGLAISRDGTIAVARTAVNNGLDQDELGFVDPATASLIGAAVPITFGGNPLTGIEGLAYGSPDLSGTDSLYAIYKVDLGGGTALPTLGKLIAVTDPTTHAILSYTFTPISQALGLGANAQVEGMAFAPGGTNFDPNHQGLYIAADTNANDSDTTATLFQVNPLTGAIVNLAGIGPIVNAKGNPITIGGLAFDANGDLIAFDKQQGNLVDVNLTNGRAGANVNTQIGTLNPTVGAITVDPATGILYAIDNETSLPTGGSNDPGTPSILGSAILMQIKDFTKASNAQVNLGKFLFDGTVTGKVTISGSMNTFYAGWLIVGDAGDGRGYIARPNTDPTVLTSAASEGLLTDNFTVGGDLLSLLSFGSIGTNGTTANGSLVPAYTTGVDILIGGKLGTLNTDGAFSGHLMVGDDTNIPDITDNGLIDGSPQSEIQYWENAVELPTQRIPDWWHRPSSMILARVSLPTTVQPRLLTIPHSTMRSIWGRFGTR